MNGSSPDIPAVRDWLDELDRALDHMRTLRIIIDLQSDALVEIATGCLDHQERATAALRESLAVSKG